MNDLTLGYYDLYERNVSGVLNELVCKMGDRHKMQSAVENAMRRRQQSIDEEGCGAVMCAAYSETS